MHTAIKVLSTPYFVSEDHDQPGESMKGEARARLAVNEMRIATANFVTRVMNSDLPPI